MFLYAYQVRDYLTSASLSASALKYQALPRVPGGRLAARYKKRGIQGTGLVNSARSAGSEIFITPKPTEAFLLAKQKCLR